ncbi:MAG: hypothetical protein ACR2FO_04315 [Actinomycetota bacterium]
MKALRKGLIVAVIQMLLVTMVGAKLLVDRSRYPQVWVQTAPYDPDSPLRGRYVRLLAVVESQGRFDDPNVYEQPGRLLVRGNSLVAVRDDNGPVYFTKNSCGDQDCLTLTEPLAFFIPEHVKDPSIRAGDEQLWVKVTVPPRGLPRPIELGVKKNGNLTPLKF